MKIRRTLTAAAAAAVLAPASVLAAPAAAFATEPASEAGPRTPASPDLPDAATPAGGGATGGGRNANDSDGAGQSCAFESDQLHAAVRGLPHQLTAGGAWTPFSMTLTNTTGKALGEVQPFLLVSSAEDVDRPYWELETEYRDAKTGRWKTFHDAAPEDLFGFFAVGPRSAVTLQLRTRVVKDAKPGAGYALAAGDYRNRDGSCGSTKEAWYDFTVLPRGAKPTQPATTEPGEPGGTAEPSHSAAPASQAAPAAEIPTCYDVSNGQYRNNALVGRSFGIPKSIPLGTQWTTYTATLTNASVKELKSLELRAKLGSYVYNEGERDLSPYGDLQYWDASQRAWKTLRQADGNAGGSVPGPKTLKPRESVHVQLRFRVSKDLPLDQTYDAFTGLTGTFVDRYRDTDCTSHGDADGGFYPRKG